MAPELKCKAWDKNEMSKEINLIAAERQRVQAEYVRREREISPTVYAPWQPSELFMKTERKRVAARKLHEEGVFPKAGDKCVEVGFGSVGWLGELISWGVPETDICGIELDSVRAKRAQELLPLADLRVGDATVLPWKSGTFQIVISSTVFTSILDPDVRGIVAGEINRVLAPGGALLWYDFAVNNPSNPGVRRVDRSELKRLFPQLRGGIRSITLAPPLARFLAPRSWVLATLFEAIPLLRTHLLAVLVKR
jgi:ubiquinone/menaquinone biosynthesis C-methylase UbiE